VEPTLPDFGFDTPSDVPYESMIVVTAANTMAMKVAAAPATKYAFGCTASDSWYAIAKHNRVTALDMIATPLYLITRNRSPSVK